MFLRYVKAYKSRYRGNSISDQLNSKNTFTYNSKVKWFAGQGDFPNNLQTDFAQNLNGGWPKYEY